MLRAMGGGIRARELSLISSFFHSFVFYADQLVRPLLSLFLSVFVYCIKRGRGAAGGELRHLAGQPGGGGDSGTVILKVE